MDEKDTPPSRFESEMTRMMQTAIQTINGMDSRLVNIEKDVSDNGKKIDTLTAQFGEVVSLVINNDGRLTKLEGEVTELQSEIH